ncbi:MAG TPA: hypothetical protein DEH25_13870 [Chloroflexi bacterium]|nr:hypothetical protein [Chloroflexota bacterium]HBY09099.1 hypothetical protein [Chloroflexota bacterium]
MDKSPKPNRSELSAYDLFITIITGLAVIGVMVILIPFFSGTAKELAISIDSFFCVLFFADFCYLWSSAPNKRAYFLKWGWIDFLGSLPYLSILRLLRIPRAFRVVQSIRKGRLKGLKQVLKKHPERTTFLGISLFAISIVSMSSYLILRLEQLSPTKNIKNASDALWWSIVTVTTVGYGDRVPTTNVGRIVAGLLMFVGIGIFSALTSYLSTAFINRPDQDQKRKDENDEITLRLNAIEQQLKELTALIKKKNDTEE